jgi:hypothetical protein
MGDSLEMSQNSKILIRAFGTVNCCTTVIVLLIIENIVLWDTESQEKIDRMGGLRIGEELILRLSENH